MNVDSLLSDVYLPPQMIDKLWYDWQHLNTTNFWSFGGGSVSTVNANFTVDPEFPTGAPPFVNVRSLSISICSTNRNPRSSGR